MRVPSAVLALPLLAVFAAAGGGVTAGAAAEQPVSPAKTEAGPSDKATKSIAVPQKRLAFVVGDGSYAAGPLPTAANDAGLVAQTLQAGGFEVIGARDLDGETLRQSYADFLKRVSDAGPDTVAFVYLSGYGLQYGDSNYYVPVGAAVSGAVDIPVQSVRLSDLIAPLAALPLRARFTVFDAAYQAPFKVDGGTVGGFALTDAGPDALVAFNAAPGTVAPTPTGNFGSYALALASTLREPGLSPEQLFERVRLRVSAATDGGEVPWDASKVDEGFRFFEGGKDAAPAASAGVLGAAPLRELPISEAYPAALARDTLGGYGDFVRDFGSDPLAGRGRALLALRREALTWRGAVTIGTPAALQSYLGRYGKGEHAEIARRRLAEMSASPTLPPGAEPVAFDVPAPPADELVFVDGPAVDLAALHLPPVPAPPAGWLPEPAEAAADEVAAPEGLFALPVPRFRPLPLSIDPPDFVAYPAGNAFFASGFGGAVPFGGNIAIGSRMVVSRIHQTPMAALAGGSGRQGIALPDAADRREAELASRGIATPARLAALRLQPGGVVGALAGRDAALLPDTQDAAFTPQTEAAPRRTAAAEPDDRVVRTGRSSRTDEPIEPPAAARPRALDRPAETATVPAVPTTPAAPAAPAVRRGRVGEASRSRERTPPALRFGGAHAPEGRKAEPGDVAGAGREPAHRPPPQRRFADRGPDGRSLTDGGALDRTLREPQRDTLRAPASRAPGLRGPIVRGPMAPAPVRREPGDKGRAERGERLASREAPALVGRRFDEFRGDPRLGFDGGPRFGVPRPGPRFGFPGGPRFGRLYVVPRPGRFGGPGPGFGPRPGFIAGPRPGLRPGVFAGGPRPGGFEGSYGGGLGSGFGGGFGGNF